MKFNEIQNLQENQAVIKQLQDREDALTRALGRAKEINKNMKRDDTHINILSQLGVLAEDVGLQLDSYQESKVLQLHNQLESACYELEEVFEDAIRDVQNKLEELGVEY